MKGRVQTKKSFTGDGKSCFSIDYSWESTFFADPTVRLNLDVIRNVVTSNCFAGRRWGWRGGRVATVVEGRFRHEDYVVVKCKESGWRGWMVDCRLLDESLFFFVIYIIYIYIYFFFRGFEMLGLKPFLELWVTELYLRFFFFLAAGSRHLLVQNPWGLDRQFARLFWAMPPAGMGATGRYEACGILDFDCMVGWQPVLAIFNERSINWKMMIKQHLLRLLC